MKNKFKKSLRFLKDLSIHFSRDISNYFYKGWQAGLLWAYTISFFRFFIFYLNQFRIYLYSGGIQIHHHKEERMKRLQHTAMGLHSLLPKNPLFTYSILMCVDQPRMALFQESLESLLHQSAPHLEILIGCIQPLSKEMDELLMRTTQNHPSKVKIFHFSSSQSQLEIINTLAEKASGNFFMIMGEEDWIRPDCLLRYEQTLRVFSNPEKRILYCNLNALNDKGYFIPNSEYRQPKQFIFPFLFEPVHEKGLLIPASLWKASGGLHRGAQGAEYERLLLQCDLAGAQFQHIPLSLYSQRTSYRKKIPKSQTAFLKVLEEDTQTRGLHWKWSVGYQEGKFRALPPLPENRWIQIIVPYKDQKELTLKCVHSLVKQKDVQFQMTAVDNGSTDGSIAEEIQSVGGEVIHIPEPFNYSRLNNLALQMTQTAKHCDVLLFLNNDVELDENALNEMLRWVEQPKIGIVGCRLHYPDGRLQHGGVNIHSHSREEMRWEHIEKLRRFEEMGQSKNLGFFDAVTAACAMMKRQTFLEVGGFDEVWYPIGYSDTHLALKVAAKGLKCFYTPYATGIHHESVSRKGAIEDFENSWWLHHLLKENI